MHKLTIEYAKMGVRSLAVACISKADITLCKSTECSDALQCGLQQHLRSTCSLTGKEWCNKRDGLYHLQNDASTADCIVLNIMIG